MREQKKNRSRWLHIRLSTEEQALLKQRFEKTTCRKLSDYARRILFDKKITTYYRNQSLDDCMAELMLLRKELNAIGNNFNQTTKRLHTLDTCHELVGWIPTAEKTHARVLQQVNAIQSKIYEIADKWLQ